MNHTAPTSPPTAHPHPDPDPAPAPDVEIRVHLLPDHVEPGELAGTVVVVLDVLRATTVMARALDAGADAVIPCLEIEDALETARQLERGPEPAAALLGGERGGLPIPGFDLGNSPDDYTPARCRGRTLVVTTTNGTRAILASIRGGARRVLAASLVNRAATAELLAAWARTPTPATAPETPTDPSASPLRIHMMCAGTEGRTSWEDALGAGALAVAIAERLETPPRRSLHLANDEALLATRAWRDVEANLPRRPLASVLREGRGGRNVVRIGLESDFPAVAALDSVELAVLLDADDGPRPRLRGLRPQPRTRIDRPEP